MSRALVLLLSLLVGFPVGNAAAQDDPVVDAGDDDLTILVQDENDGNTTGTGNAADGILGTYHQEPACEAVCTGERTCSDGSFMMHSWVELPDGTRTSVSYWCPSEGAPAITSDLIATAFRRIPLPPSSFSIQPPGGKTLVNFETNFFTEEQTLDRTVRLLGQRVDLRIWAHSYTWHFGDGESITTRKPGAPFPKLRITHNYLEKGAYRPTMDTTWVADYRVGGGAWQSVPGSVTIEGDPADLQAIEASPTLVGYGG